MLDRIETIAGLKLLRVWKNNWFWNLNQSSFEDYIFSSLSSCSQVVYSFQFYFHLNFVNFYIFALTNFEISKSFKLKLHEIAKVVFILIYL